MAEPVWSHKKSVDSIFNLIILSLFKDILLTDEKIQFNCICKLRVIAQE